ncbi:hypothetical protein [Aeromonas caviae]|uniref:hypothetical protein n=1 Tax=Aeromonas caviae TaxID=648 RepID=UPI0029D9FAE1|nr:hypothetical protein [Aeromonas caviae]MDX7711773.1 hypothetical protein [Aeromonas caviae]
MTNAYQLQQKPHMSLLPNPRASVRTVFMDEVTNVMGRLRRERFQVLGNMLASELYCSQFSQSDLVAMAKSGNYMMGTTVRVSLLDSYLPTNVDGRYCHVLRLREPLPFPIGFQGFELSASSEYGAAIQDYIRERDRCELGSEFRDEIQAIANRDLFGLKDPKEMLAELAKCGPVSNQVAYDLSRAAGKFELDPKGVSL